MRQLKIKPIIGNTELWKQECDRIMPLLISKWAIIVNYSNQADAKILFWWDWSIFHEARRDLRNWIKRIVPIVWIKAWNPKSKWMLLNDFSWIEDAQIIYDGISNSITEKFNYLEGFIDWKKEYAFNDITSIRSKAQSAATNVYLDWKLIFERALWDWLIISTPQWSAAYNEKAWWVINSTTNTFQITGISSVFSSLILDNSSKIKLVTLESEKRPQRVEIDWRIVARNVKEIEISGSNRFSLINFVQWRSFRDKIISEILRSSSN